MTTTRKVVNYPDNSAKTATEQLDTELEFQTENKESLNKIAALLLRILNHQRVTTGVEADKGEEF